MSLSITEKSLAEQMQLTDREIASRKKLLHFEDSDIVHLTSCRQIIFEAIDSIVNRFYETQIQNREISLLIGDADTFARLRMAMRQYVIELFDGFYGAEYVNKRLRIGKVHKQIGVSPKYYVSAIWLLESIIKQELAGRVDESSRERVNTALHKLILFDVQLVFDTYIASHLAEVASAKIELENYTESLERIVAERTEQLEALTRQDTLTLLRNQRAFNEELRREVAVAERQKYPLSLVYFDLDGFKEHNDTHGHRSGDEVLCQVGQSVLDVMRETDVPCRNGGDEFCIIAPGATSAEARILCERLIENFRQKYKDITFSIGIAEHTPGAPMTPGDLVKEADRCMYISKGKAQKERGFHMTISNIGEVQAKKYDDGHASGPQINGAKPAELSAT